MSPRRWQGLLVLAASCVFAPLAAIAEPAAAPRIDQRQVCLECHDDLAAALDAAVAHPPAREGDCTACHNPHVSRFAGLLKERPGPLCLECHQDLRQELDLAVVHGPVAEGRCIACHQPHGGKNAALLVAPGIELCVSCHQEIETWQGRKVRHTPFRQEKCATCHQPHAAAFPHLSRLPAVEVCASCHPRNAAFRTAHRGYPVERADCGGCHDPHASARAGFFRENLHPPFEDGDCADCHAPPDAAEPFRIAGGLDVLCGECHEDVVAATRSAPFPHLAEAGGACTSCHNPHAGDGQGLLKKPLRELCVTCHDPGGSSSQAAGRYVSHADLDCTTCHGAHGGELPTLMVAGAVELCGECHSHQHSITHPMGEAARDPRTGQPMDCLSCHGIHDAPYPKYMHREGKRELCISCHTDRAGGSR